MPSLPIGSPIKHKYLGSLSLSPQDYVFGLSVRA